MPEEPRVGARSDDHRAVCAYSPVPGAPQCANRAILHYAIEHETGIDGIVGLATCAAHADIAAATGPVAGVHEHQAWCGLPGTRWQDDACVLDGTGQSAATRAFEALKEADHG